jgi:hypothetical protein
MFKRQLALSAEKACFQHEKLTRSARQPRVLRDFPQPGESLREMKSMLRRVGLILLGCVLAGTPACGQQWAREMFPVNRHDFGTVARGAKAEFEFELSNIYLEDVHIASVRSSCGCTTPRIKTPLLKTYEKGAIIASINTPTFLGQRGATVTVTFDRPYYAEVQLHVSVYIRSDVLVEPGSIQLGSVEQGAAVENRVAVNYTGGRSDWRILQVKSASPLLKADVVETSRRGGQVSYELVARLSPDAPAGYVNDHLLLVTNDQQATQIPVAVEGRVLAPVTISPASLFMGVVQPGQKVTKQLVVKGSRPFRILSISCDDKSFEFSASAEEAPKPLHIVPVTFVAGPDAGKVTKTIYIATDLGGAKPELSAYAVIAAQ